MKLLYLLAIVAVVFFALALFLFLFYVLISFYNVFIGESNSARQKALWRGLHIAGIVVIILGLLLSPFAAIWSINVLFGVGIKYTLKSYFAMFFLNALVSAATGRNHVKKI